MEKYTYSDVIIDPHDPRVEVGKQYYYDDRPASVVGFANNSNRIHFGILSEIQQESGYPFIFGIAPYVCIIRKKEPTYAERQDKWLADNGINKGDKVRIVRKADSYEDGWGCCWNPDMDKAVGNVGSVCHIFSNLREWGIEIDVPDVGPFLYPYFVLEKVETRYEPFDLSEESDRARLRGAWVRDKKSGVESQVIAIDHNTVIIDDDYFETDRMLERFEFIDGTPCGKLMEDDE